MIRNASMCLVLLCPTLALAQQGPAPFVVLGPPGANTASAVACFPDFTIAGVGGVCTFTIVTPNIPDLACIKLVNVKTMQDVQPTTPTPTCKPVLPNTQVTMSFPRPAFGTGSILGFFIGFRANGQVTMSSGGVVMPDIGFPRFFNMAVCPLRQLDASIPKPDPLCPQLGNDVSPNEFPDF